MSDGIEVDFSEVLELARTLETADRRVLSNARKAVEVSSRHVRDGWRKRAKRRGLQGYAASVDYTVKRFEAFGGATVEGEIGPNLSRRRSLAAFGLVEDGGSKVRSAPQHAGRDALEEVQEDFERGLAIAAEKAVLGDP